MYRGLLDDGWMDGWKGLYMQEGVLNEWVGGIQAYCLEHAVYEDWKHDLRSEMQVNDVIYICCFGKDVWIFYVCL